MELRLLLFSFQQLEGQAPDLGIPHVAQKLVPCLASHVLTHLTGAALEQSEALLQDPQANEYGRMVFPMSPALLHLQVQQAISTKEVHMLRQFVETQTSDASNSQQQKDELDEIRAELRKAEQAITAAEELEMLLEKACSDVKELEAQAVRKETEIVHAKDQLRASAEQSSQEIANLQDRLREAVRKGENASADSHLRLTTAEDHLKASEDRLKVSEDQLKAALQQEKSLRTLLREADARKASDDDRLQAARNYGKALEERLQQAEDRVNPLEAQLNTFEQRSRTAQANTDKLSKQKQDLEDNVRSLTSKCDEATEKLHFSEIECAKLREELRTKIEAEKRSENTRRSNRHAGSDTAFATTIALDALKKNLKSADQKAQRLQAELDGMRAQITETNRTAEASLQAPQEVRLLPTNPIWRDAARYSIDPQTRTVGAGAHGRVRVVRDDLTRNRVVVKVNEIPPPGVLPQHIGREIDFLAESSCDYVVPLLDVVQFMEGQHHFLGLVMPFYPRDLEGVIYDFARNLNVKDITHYASQILSGLSFLASRDIIHCDLKPANLLVGKNHQLVLADFGLAEIRVRPQQRRVIASMNYRSPECFFRTEQRGQSLDIWAFGVILAEMIGRALPWDGSTPLDIFEQILRHTGVPYQAELFPGAGKLPGVFHGQDMHSERSIPPTGQVKIDPRPRLLPMSIDTCGTSRDHFRDLLALVDRTLVLDPARRPSASRLLESTAFRDSDPRGDRKMQPFGSELRASDVAEIRRSRRRL
ncbi:hypothetical protein CF328_g6951 [Tilletia controversa]|nr:hypothetical protein CF328_g6951 [Tilletia controversa]